MGPCEDPNPKTMRATRRSLPRDIFLTWCTVGEPRCRSAVLSVPLFAQTPLEKITVNYAARTGTTWPLYLAKEGGYYKKYGLDVNLVFAVHPAGIAMVVSGEAAMTNYPLEQAMPAAPGMGPC